MNFSAPTVKLFTVVGFSLVVAAGSAASSPSKPAPDVTLPAEDGSMVRLADLQGRVVLLDFWASWCIPCRASFPAINRLHEELRSKGLTVLAINVDEQRKDADAFLSGRPHTLMVLFDPAGRSPEAFKVKGMPSGILLDRQGRIRITHMGYTEKTLDRYREEILSLLGES